MLSPDYTASSSSQGCYFCRNYGVLLLIPG
jgi:hypothetical protein